MRTSTYRSASGFFSLGDIDIGAEEASRERDIEVDNGDNGDGDDDDNGDNDGDDNIDVGEERRGG